MLIYIAGTINFGIWYSDKSNLVLSGHCDSDWQVIQMTEGACQGIFSPWALEQFLRVQRSKI